MSRPFAVRFLLCCAGLLACTTGCSCSSHIPESPPGDGPVGEIRNVQTGQVIQQTPGGVPAVPNPNASNPSSTPTYSQPANANHAPVPGQPAPVKPATTSDTLP
jgi:hypothetical protein